MQITGITVGGYRNIESVNINFTSQLNALIGFNNYGKSNLLQGIAFGLQYIKEDMANRKKMMRLQTAKPLSKALEDKPFKFQISFIYKNQNWRYSYSWFWDEEQILNEELARDNRIIHNRNPNTQVVPGLSLLIDKLNSSLQEVYAWIKSISIYGADLVSDIKSNTIIYKPLKLTLAEAIYLLQTTDLTKYHLLLEAYTSLLPDIEWVKAIKQNSECSLYVKEKNMKDSTPFEYLSLGSRRLMALLYMVVKAIDYNIKVLFFEEVETCLHPRLIPLLLMSLSKLAINSNILVTSHSPYLIQHLPLSNVYLSTPQKEGVAGFKTINPLLHDKLIKQAQELEISLGVYLFDLLIESYYEPETLAEWQ